MKKLLLLLAAVTLSACAKEPPPIPPDPPVMPTNDQLQPFYPSPYADKGWVYGHDCRWTSGPVKLPFLCGACRYSPNANAANNHGAQGWAEVHWSKWDLVPLSAVPCSVRGDKPNIPQCRFDVWAIPPINQQD